MVGSEMITEQKEIYVLTDYKFLNEQGAAFERIRCYAKALANRKWMVFIHDQSLSLSQEGQRARRLDNLYFNVTSSGKKGSKFYQMVGRYFDFVTPFRTVSFISKCKERNTPVLIYTSSFFLLFWSVIIFKWNEKGKLVVEKNEMEFSIILNQFSFRNLPLIFLSLTLLPWRLWLAILSDLLTMTASKVISISTRIHRIYKSRSVRIPVIVDNDRFDVAAKNPEKAQIKKGIYLGEITAKKDGLFELVEVISNLKKDVQIDIIGNGTPSIITKLKNKISFFHVADKIFILPSITSQEVERALLKYDFALLLRAKNAQTQFGFSTKLGEYLSADLPVFYTDVSDNKMYLENSSSQVMYLNNIVTAAQDMKLGLERIENDITGKGPSRELAERELDYRKFKDQLEIIF
jgi:hypothetical protein